jgi:hypothetical protein
MIPLTWVWAICHGMWPVGIIIGIAAVVGLALDGRRRNELARFAAVPILSAVAAALTPAGPRLYSAVLLVGSRAHYFAEWSPPDFKTGPALVLAAMLAVLLLVRLRGGRMPWPELSLAGLTIVWALYSSRTVPVGAAMAAPLLAMALQSVSPSRAPGGRGERRVVLGGFAASVAVLGLLVPVTAADPPSQPSWVDTALRALPDHTKVLDNGDWGGLLMWRYPQLDLVMHGYGDTFTDAELKRNDDLTQVQPGWDILVKQTGARYAFLAPDSALAYGLRTSQGWRVLHASKDVEMLEAPTGSGP